MSTLKTNNIQHVDRSDPSIIINTDGSVNIAGTMTYEDVTNVDAVGIITGRSLINAQKQIHVGTGVSVKSGGLNVTAGITTVQALQATTGTFSGDVDVADKIIHTGDTNTAIRFPEADHISFETSGSEALRVDGSQRLLIGHTTNRQTRSAENNISPDIQLESDSVAAMAITRFSDTIAPARFILQKARGSKASPTVAQDGDSCGQILFSAWDGDTFTNSAEIRSEVDGTPGDDDMPGNLVFSTTSDGSNLRTERMRITSEGKLLIGSESTRNVSGADSSAYLQLEGTSANSSSFSLINNQNTTQSPVIRFGKTRGTSDGAVTTVADGDALGKISFSGADGTDLENNTAQIKAEVNGTVSGNTVPTDLLFETSATNGSSRETRMRILSNGNIGIGLGNPTYKLHVYGGNMRIAQPAGTDCTLDIQEATTTNPLRLSQTATEARIQNIASIPLNIRSQAGTGSTAHIAFWTRDSERMRISEAGSVRIENTDYSAQASGNELIIGTTSGDNGITIASGGSGTGNIYFGDDGSNSIGYMRYDHNSNFLKFNVNGGEKFRIASDGQTSLFNDMTIDAAGQSNPSCDLILKAGEGGSAQIYLYADEGDDDSDKWRISAMTGFSNRLIFFNASGDGTLDDKLSFQTDGTIRPGTDNSANLGTASYRWANVHTADLHCSNEGKTNDVDGTWGSYTIQEGESDLFLINNRSGKKYKFNLTEVS